MLSLVAPSIVEQSVHKNVGVRLGNRHAVHSPHGCFRCKGADDWIVIAVATDEQWNELCQVIGRSDFKNNGEFDTANGRRAREGEIEAAIGAWTKNYSGDEAMALLQMKRVPAGVARSISALLHDPHLIQRNYWRYIERPFAKRYLSGGTFYVENREPTPIRRHAPTLGQDNAKVFSGMLGLTESQLCSLAARGVIGTEAIPKQAPAK